MSEQLKQIKERVHGANNGFGFALIKTDDLDWLLKQTELAENLIGETSGNKIATVETEIEHLKDLVRYYHSLWKDNETENEKLNEKLIHTESTLEYVRERCRNVMETSRNRFDEIRKLKDKIDSQNAFAVQQEFCNAELREEIDRLKLNTIPKEFGTGELLVRISELEAENNSLTNQRDIAREAPFYQCHHCGERTRVK